MQEKLERVLKEAGEKLDKAVSVADAEEIRVSITGKKGKLTQILRKSLVRRKSWAMLSAILPQILTALTFEQKR